MRAVNRSIKFALVNRVPEVFVKVKLNSMDGVGSQIRKGVGEGAVAFGLINFLVCWVIDALTIDGSVARRALTATVVGIRTIAFDCSSTSIDVN